MRSPAAIKAAHSSAVSTLPSTHANGSFCQRSTLVTGLGVVGSSAFRLASAKSVRRTPFEATDDGAAAEDEHDADDVAAAEDEDDAGEVDSAAPTDAAAAASFIDKSNGNRTLAAGRAQRSRIAFR